jgi:hypothetical protein
VIHLTARKKATYEILGHPPSLVYWLAFLNDTLILANPRTAYPRKSAFPLVRSPKEANSSASAVEMTDFHN